MANSFIVEVRKLSKEFSYTEKISGGVFSSFKKREKKILKAVDDISFNVARGETLAFIGPNGAGKSTTIKMLTGILHPSEGTLRVAGHSPQTEREKLAYHIGTVFGQRSQLVFNLPIIDSFELFGYIYGIEREAVKKKSEELIEIFDLAQFRDQPVRKLSLGQRMRSEIAISLLHEPEIIFLDEPTIGLDIVAKKNLRKTLTNLNKEKGTTIFLTSHDAGDIEALCERTIIVNHGKIIVDRPTVELSNEYLTDKYLRVELKNKSDVFEIPECRDVVAEDNIVTMKVNTKKYPLNKVIGKILRKYDIKDIDVNDAPLEDVISHIYEHR